MKAITRQIGIKKHIKATNAIPINVAIRLLYITIRSNFFIIGL
jgi:hypothetical protein